jgi:2'-5' RNA ligase
MMSHTHSQLTYLPSTMKKVVIPARRTLHTRSLRTSFASQSRIRMSYSENNHEEKVSYASVVGTPKGRSIRSITTSSPTLGPNSGANTGDTKIPPVAVSPGSTVSNPPKRPDPSHQGITYATPNSHRKNFSDKSHEKERKPIAQNDSATRARGAQAFGSGSRYEGKARPAYRPNTKVKGEHAYVLTLKISDQVAQPMNALREQWFPVRLNKTPAHLTLFHALPHSRLKDIQMGLVSATERTEPFVISTGRPFRMRRGVGIGLGLGRGEAKAVHGSLRETWSEFLSEQDAQGWRPHWTVMNKEDEEARVKEAFESINETLGKDEMNGMAKGLSLWIYNRGKWDWKEDFDFHE